MKGRSGFSVYTANGALKVNIQQASSNLIIPQVPLFDDVYSEDQIWMPPGISPLRMGASAHQSAGQSVANASNVTLAFDTNNYDTSGIHSTSVNNTRFTVPQNGAGIWIFNGGVAFPSAAAIALYIYLQKNGGTIVQLGTRGIFTPDSSNTVLSSFTAMDLAIAGDYYEFVCAQFSGGTINTDPTTYYTRASGTRIG